MKRKQFHYDFSNENFPGYQGVEAKHIPSLILMSECLYLVDTLDLAIASALWSNEQHPQLNVNKQIRLICYKLASRFNAKMAIAVCQGICIASDPYAHYTKKRIALKAFMD